MATFDGITAKDPVHAGEYGNQSVAHGKVVFASPASNNVVGTINRYCKIPAGSKVVGFREAHGLCATAAGAATTIAFSWVYVDGTAGGSVILAATDVDAAGGTTASALVPFVVEKDIYIIGTIAGDTALAAAESHVIVNYIHRGTK